MPVSIDLMDNDVIACLRQAKPDTILDVGIGAGKMGRLIRKTLGSGPRLVGIEAYGPYQEVYQSEWATYTSTEINTFDAHLMTNPEAVYDMIIFGDVLEHMRWADAISALYDAAYRSKHFLGVWPELCLQMAMPGGNAFEAHRSRLADRDVSRWGMEYDVTRATESGYKKRVVMWKGYR